MIKLTQSYTPKDEAVRPIRKVRICLLLPVVVGAAIFLAPVGIVVLFKTDFLLEIAGLFWVILLAAAVAAIFAKKRCHFWVIYSSLVVFAVLNAIGGIRFFEGISTLH